MIYVLDALSKSYNKLHTHFPAKIFALLPKQEKKTIKIKKFKSFKMQFGSFYRLCTGGQV